MATAHIIEVPVEALEIIELPGLATFVKYASSSSRLGHHATLRLRPVSNRHDFKRHVVISDIRITDERIGLGIGPTDMEDPMIGEDGREVLDEEAVKRNVVEFRCKLSGHYFASQYNFRTHSGRLVAIEDPQADEAYQP